MTIEQLPAGLIQIANRVYEDDMDAGYTFYNPGTQQVHVYISDSYDDVESIYDQLDMLELSYEVLVETAPEYDEGWFAIDVKNEEMLPWNDGAEVLLFT